MNTVKYQYYHHVIEDYDYDIFARIINDTGSNPDYE